jgi:hypothetical protein
MMRIEGPKSIMVYFSKFCPRREILIIHPSDKEAFLQLVASAKDGTDADDAVKSLEVKLIAAQNSLYSAKGKPEKDKEV